MTYVSIHEAKTHLSRLLRQVEAGAEVTIARGHKPIARLVPMNPTTQPRKPGLLKGKIGFSEAFFDPLPEDELDTWQGSVPGTGQHL